LSARWRVKKNDEPQPLLRRPDLPGGALELYEELRAAVLCAQPHVEGVGAIVFHGLWRGLAVLMAERSVPRVSVWPALCVPPTAVHDRQLVRLLANMVLAAESQVHHAY
jgi:hypothetical protein